MLGNDPLWFCLSLEKFLLYSGFAEISFPAMVGLNHTESSAQSEKNNANM